MNKLETGQLPRASPPSFEWRGRREGGGVIVLKQGLHHEFDIGGDGFSTLGDGAATTYPTYPQFRFFLVFQPPYFAKSDANLFFLETNR